MRRLLIILGLVTLLTGCSKTTTNKEIDTLVDNTTFDLPLLTVVTEEIKTVHYIEEGFGGYLMYDIEIDPYKVDTVRLFSESEVYIYQVTAYPDYKDGGQFITRITTNNINARIFGIYVGQNIKDKEITSILEENGYQFTNSTSSESEDIYENGQVRLRFSHNDDIITIMIAEIIITNENHIIF